MTFARRLFIIVFTLNLMTEALPLWDDVLGRIGWYLHADLKSWLPIPIAFNPIELCLVACILCWFLRGESAKRLYAFRTGRLLVPIVCFAAAIALGVLWGLMRGGDTLTYALFEVRGFGILICGYVLVGMLMRDERDLSIVVWCVLIACMGLALENLYRYYFVIKLGGAGLSDLSYDHDDSVVLGFGFILSAALFAFGGTRGQRRLALALMPISIWCMEVMQRRVAFAVVPVGLIFLAIVYFRLRPKQFWRVVPLLALLAGIYLAAFWNNTGTLGQPARAIKSQFQPDPRDASSDLYRQIEKGDILQNIANFKIMGLGFGQPYTFYDPLPDLSFWPFWHFESHNAILWVWMDGGIPAFLTFFWVLGAGTYSGGQELAVRREAWSLMELGSRRPKRHRGRSRQSTLPSTDAEGSAERSADNASNVPRMASTLHASRSRRGRRAKPVEASFTSSALALLAAGVCLGAMQVTYSYVDLGLTGQRTMMLLGVLLGVMGRTFVSEAARRSRRRTAKPAASVAVSPVPAADADALAVPLFDDATALRLSERRYSTAENHIRLIHTGGSRRGGGLD